MGRATAVDDRLDGATNRLRESLAALGRRARVGAMMVGEGRLPGSFATRRPGTGGLEPESAGPFTLDDDPTTLDLGRLGRASVANPTLALLNGDLHARRTSPTVEIEMVLVVDLSRSMLTGGTSDGDRGVPVKLGALYSVVAALLALGAASKFTMRVILASGGAVLDRRTRQPRDFLARILVTMSDELSRRWRASLLAPGASEPFSLAAGLTAAIERRSRGLVVVASDFLDPLNDDEAIETATPYTRPLATLLAHHRVILADLAAPEDLAFPMPARFDFNARRVPVREGARHVELGCAPRVVCRHEIARWNERRAADRAQLEGLVRTRGGRWLPAWGLDARQCHSAAIRLLQRMR